MVDDTPSGLLIFAISFGLLLVFVLLLWLVNIVKVFVIMSRARRAEKMTDTVVHVPVPATSTEPRTDQPAPAGTGTASPDTDAADAGTSEWEMPRLSRRLSDRDMVALLAVQRAPGGKLRYSANQIAQLVGGSRGEVLALVKSIREGPAEFRPLTPEQQAAREALGLSQKREAL